MHAYVVNFAADWTKAQASRPLKMIVGDTRQGENCCGFPVGERCWHEITRHCPQTIGRRIKPTSKDTAAPSLVNTYRFSRATRWSSDLRQKDANTIDKRMRHRSYPHCSGIELFKVRPQISIVGRFCDETYIISTTFSYKIVLEFLLWANFVTTDTYFRPHFLKIRHNLDFPIFLGLEFLLYFSPEIDSTLMMWWRLDTIMRY